MKPDELRAALSALRLTATELGRWHAVDSRSVRRWLDGTRPIPPSLSLLLACLIAYPALLGVIRARVAMDEIMRLPEDQERVGPKRLSCRNASAWPSRDAVP